MKWRARTVTVCSIATIKIAAFERISTGNFFVSLCPFATAAVTAA